MRRSTCNASRGAHCTLSPGPSVGAGADLVAQYGSDWPNLTGRSPGSIPVGGSGDTRFKGRRVVPEAGDYLPDRAVRFIGDIPRLAQHVGHRVEDLENATSPGSGEASRPDRAEDRWTTEHEWAVGPAHARDWPLTV